ncbi:MAG TPA: phosphoribosylamine--glycine ligase [Dehalococcoidia bacterium]|nr:phosphoribosylamine--glycine ligase [Dehalococcoidia bacterium]
MKVLVIGSGAREHAITWKLRQSPRVEELSIAPGNGGTAQIAQNLDIKATDFEALTAAAHHMDLVVVGPEEPLARGIVDHFERERIPIVGPTQAAAEIESSKIFAKALMEKYGIPTAQGCAFSSYNQARAYVEQQDPPLVVKADGLTAGKGVIVAKTAQEALGALYRIMVERAFGAAGERVIIEECLEGREVSLMAFTDGSTVVPMLPVCDYKRAHDGDQGPNTGGMGSYCPPAFFTAEMMEEARVSVLEPAVKAMSAEGRPYQGILYAGLMVTERGLKVLEFNCRFGDPETQVIMPLLETDLAQVLWSVYSQTLSQVPVRWSRDTCVGVVMASKGYPESYATGYPISGLGSLEDGVQAFHAGTGQASGLWLTSGGRVLTVAPRGENMGSAREKVYRNASRIHFEGAHYRKDIAAREVA